MVLDIAEFLKKAEPIGSKGLGKIVGQIPVTLLSGEKVIGDIFEGNAILVRYKNDKNRFNILIVGTSILYIGKKAVINKKQDIYMMFEQPIGEKEARDAYDSLSTIQ